MSKIKGLDELFGDVGKQPSRARAELEDDDDEPEQPRRARAARDDDDDLPQEPAGFGAQFEREWKRPQRRGSNVRNHPERGEAARIHRLRMRNLRENPPEDDETVMQDDQDEYAHGSEEQEPEPRSRARAPKTAAYMPAAKTTDHCTPAVIGEALALLWAREADGQPGIDLDPCASDSGLQVVHAKVELRGPEHGEDGITFDWCSVAPSHRPARVYANCPYGKAELDAWVPKMARESVGTGGGSSVVGLLPARTSSGWFHDHVLAHASGFAVVRSRLKFVGSKAAAPFSSILPLWSDDPEEIDRFEYAFAEAKLAKIRGGFRALGRVVVLRR